MYAVKRGATKSCGCSKRNKPKLSQKGTRQYSIWINMKNRCRHKNNPNYKNYGGRGIFYDPAWEKFDNFWKDMEIGYKENLTLDRIDNNKGYYKENCRWATARVQANNKRNNVRFLYKGEMLQIHELSLVSVVKLEVLRSRILSSKWDVAKAVETPLMKIRKRNKIICN